jgi:DNA repair protein RadC
MSGSVYTILQMPSEERPRERLSRFGPEAISSAELIAIILGSGMRGKSVLQLAQELLNLFGSLKDLANASIEELCTVKGLGSAKAVQLKAAFSLGLKVASQEMPPRFQIHSPQHAYNLVKDELENAESERFVVILQDTKGGVIRHETVSIGTLSQTIIHPREVFHPAIRHKAASIVLAHNHPSGDPTPSPEDYSVTEILVDAGKTLGIPVNDHIVIGRQCYISMREQGACFSC